MSFIQPLKAKFYIIPKPIRAFLLRVIVVFIVWKVLYHTLLLPTQIPDAWLTHISAKGASILTSWLYPSTAITVVQVADIAEQLFVNGKRTIGIAHNCNALELYVLYIGYIICRPAPIKKRLIYIILGIVIIYLLNIIRIAGLGWLYLEHPRMVDFAHKYAFKAVVYFTIYLLWNEYSKQKNTAMFKHQTTA